MARSVLEAKLHNWVADHEQNGIKQHSRKWKTAKVNTIGGSSLAIIQGKNPYSNIYRLIGEKIGMFKFISDIKPQWGNLFEDVIKRYVEHDKKCHILGEDLYIEGPPGTSYSPDGLAVLDVIEEYMFEEESVVDTPTGPQKAIHMVVTAVPKTTIALIEFKCPYSRIPSGNPPEYYIPQVKMGLDLLDIPTVGLFVEGVFRRCTWEQLGNNPLFDRTLVSKSSGKLPLAYGILGFYFDADRYERELKKLQDDPKTLTDAAVMIKQKEKFFAKYNEQYVESGETANGFMSNDLGEAPPELFTMLMDCYDKKIIAPWYGNIIFVDSNIVTNNGKASADEITAKLAEMNMIEPKYNENYGAELSNNDLTRYTEFCSTRRHMNFGILPWKLFRIDYNFIQKTDNYISPWLPKINEIIEVVRKCNDAPSASIKRNIYDSYVNNRVNGGFSDS